MSIVKKALTGIAIAVALGVSYGMKMHDDGASDPSYIFFISLAFVVVMLIVAPQKFSTDHHDPDDWSGDIPSLDLMKKKRPANEVGNLPSESANDDTAG